MKTAFTLLAAILLSLSGFAFDEGMLTISLPSDKFTVTVNGRIYQVTDNTVTLENIRSGEYRVKIYSYGTNTGNMRRYREPLYSSFISVKANFHVDMMINRFGKVYIDEEPLLSRGPARYNKNHQRGTGLAMSDQDFNVLLQRVNEISFSDDKMVLIRDAAYRNQFFASQVVKLVQQFSFESDKLELAKLLYRSTADKNNFYLVYNEFRFSSTRSELEKYIIEIRYQ